MNAPSNAMSHGERESALEVISQYDLGAKAQALAMARVNERARQAPFNSKIAYMVAHNVCAELSRAEA